MELVKATGVLL